MPLQSALNKLAILVISEGVVNSDRDDRPNCQTNKEGGGDEDALQMWLFVLYAFVSFVCVKKVQTNLLFLVLYRPQADLRVFGGWPFKGQDLLWGWVHWLEEGQSTGSIWATFCCFFPPHCNASSAFVMRQRGGNPSKSHNVTWVIISSITDVFASSFNSKWGGS